MNLILLLQTFQRRIEIKSVIDTRQPALTLIGHAFNFRELFDNQSQSIVNCVR
jgi:hypothetical protein